MHIVWVIPFILDAICLLIPLWAPQCCLLGLLPSKSGVNNRLLFTSFFQAEFIDPFRSLTHKSSFPTPPLTSIPNISHRIFPNKFSNKKVMGVVRPSGTAYLATTSTRKKVHDTEKASGEKGWPKGDKGKKNKKKRRAVKKMGANGQIMGRNGSKKEAAREVEKEEAPMEAASNAQEQQKEKKPETKRGRRVMATNMGSGRKKSGNSFGRRRPGRRGKLAGAAAAAHQRKMEREGGRKEKEAMDDDGEQQKGEMPSPLFGNSGTQGMPIDGAPPP